MTMLPASVFSATTNTNMKTDSAYVKGFEDGSEAITNAVNAQICASNYKERGLSPGPECHKFYENFLLRVSRYEKIKNKMKGVKNKNGKNMERNKKNPN